jgi:hypothetical protein
MKKLLPITVALALGFAAFTAFKPATLHANSTTLSAAGPAGRPVSDSVSAVRGEVRLERGAGDASNTAVLNPVSYTSSPVNATFTAGLSPSATPAYCGAFRVLVTNWGVTDVVFYSNMTKTAIVLTGNSPAGTVVKAGTSGFMDVQARDGETVHFHGLTQTGNLSYSIQSF